jgi:hypothetical protein
MLFFSLLLVHVVIFFLRDLNTAVYVINVLVISSYKLF